MLIVVTGRVFARVVSSEVCWLLLHVAAFHMSNKLPRAPRLRGVYSRDETAARRRLRVAMTVLSTLRQRSQPTLSSFARTYATHRPLIQRILTAGFILNVLTSTFHSLSTRPTPPSTSKGKEREHSAHNDAGRPPRVAVRTCPLDQFHQFDIPI